MQDRTGTESEGREMKLFQNLFGKGSGIELAAPVAGKLVAISEVNDPTFGEEILGKGVAVIPSDNRICAPADGTVSTVFPTGHAAAITADSGDFLKFYGDKNEWTDELIVKRTKDLAKLSYDEIWKLE